MRIAIMNRQKLKLETTLGACVGMFAGVGLAGLIMAEPSFASHGAPGAPAQVAAIATALPTSPDRWGALPNLADLVERVSPSVVQIIVREAGPATDLADVDELPPEFRWFFERDFNRGSSKRPASDQLASGSGFFIEGGYIVTNNHVVDHARKLTVRLDSGKEIEASLVGRDAKTDLAVIKVDAKYAPRPLKWGESEKSRVGDSIFAVGSPFALGNTVTAGIISGRGRDINSGPYDDFFQIDAPINPGNSGGPLMNAAGEVVGVNTAIYSPSGGNVGIGFSIPSDQAQTVVRQIIDHGFVERGWLGVSIQPMTNGIAKTFGLNEPKGALVAEVTPGSPAAKAGVETLDVITAYGDRPIRDMHDLTRAVADTKPGTTQDLKIRRDGHDRTLTVRIAALDASKNTTQPAEQLATSGRITLEGSLGLQVAQDQRGPVIVEVESGSTSEEAGLRAGDRLLMVNQTKVTSPTDAQNAVAEARRKGRSAVLIQVERGGSKLFVGVPLA
jgi:serine protease Do